MNATLSEIKTTLLEILWHEIEHGTQRSVAVLYAVCFLTRNANDVTVSEINREIINRWSPSGLERVKTMAWSIAGNLS